MRALERQAAIEVALRLEAARLIRVEAVLMMDQWRPAMDAPRHHRVHRAPIIAEDKVVIRQEGRDRPEAPKARPRSEEHTSELQSLMRNSYAVFCLKKKHNTKT